MLIRPNYLVGRYDVVAWPAAVIWTAFAVERFARATSSRPHHVATIVTCVLVACSLVSVRRLLAYQPGTSLAQVRAEFLALECRHDDVVLTLSYDRDYLLYYLHRWGFRGESLPFPTWLGRQVGWIDTTADLDRDHRPSLAEDAEEVASRVRRALAGGGHVYLLADSLDPENRGRRAPIQAALDRALHEAGLVKTLVDADLGISRIASQFEGS